MNDAAVEPAMIAEWEQGATEAWVDLHWIPLGAGERTHLVVPSGRLYERVAAQRAHRRPQALYHAALLVRLDGTTWAIELAPAWSGGGVADRGVVASGPVGDRRLGRLRLFRYELRCWRDGTIPDLAYAVGGARRLSRRREQAAAVLELTHQVPQLTWGRDEAGTGEMWNSNSVVSWLLQRCGLDVSDLVPPDNGRAPGWAAGLAVAGDASSSRP